MFQMRMPCLSVFCPVGCLDNVCILTSSEFGVYCPAVIRDLILTLDKTNGDTRANQAPDEKHRCWCV